MDEDEDFLAAVEADNTSTPVEDAKPEPVTEPEIVEAPPEPEQPAPVEPVLPVGAIDVAPKQPDPGFVPLSAVLDERDRRQKLEAEIAQMRAQQAPAQTPDYYEDPEGFAQAQEVRVSQALYQANLQWSERIASMQHGAETVAKAREWGVAKCDVDPHFNAKVRGSSDPIGYVVTEYNRDQIVSQVTPDDLVQFQAWKAAQGQLQQQGGQPPPPNQAPIIPPRSLASAPSAGTMLTEPVQSDDEIFAETFGKG